METVTTSSAVNNSSGKLIPISELFSKSFALSKVIFWKIIAMTIIPVLSFIPMVVIMLLFFLVVYFSPKLGMIASMTLYSILGILALAALFFAIFVNIIGQVGTYLIIKNKDSNPKVWETFKAARVQAISFFETNILASVFIFLWFLLLIVPGFIMAIYYAFVAWVFIFEGLKNKAAMRRSKELVKGQWWAVFGRLALLVIPLWLIFFVPVLFIEEKSSAARAYSSISDVFSLIIAPFSLAYSYHIYKSLVDLKK